MPWPRKNWGPGLRRPMTCGAEARRATRTQTHRGAPFECRPRCMACVALPSPAVLRPTRAVVQGLLDASLHTRSERRARAQGVLLIPRVAVGRPMGNVLTVRAAPARGRAAGVPVNLASQVFERVKQE